MPWGTEALSTSPTTAFHHLLLLPSRSFVGNGAVWTEFVNALERVRKWYGFYVVGYVAMPEHVHLLISEPERGSLALSSQMLKQMVSRKLRVAASKAPFWQPRYYDFNVWTDRKRIEKLRYIHRNPVKRGLVKSPEDWAWSSFRHYVTGEYGGVEVESQWTARTRARLGVYPTVCRLHSH